MQSARIYFSENPPEIFHVFTLPLEVLDKTKLNPWIFHKIVLTVRSLGNSKTKNRKTTRPGNSTLIFLGHPWKFL